MSRERYLIRYQMKVEGEEAEAMIYSEISSSKWWGDETTPTDFDKALKEAKKAGARTLTVRINSPGGEVFAAIAMRTMILNAGFETVNVRVEGLCASAATLIAAIPGARVVMAEGSEFMVHNPMTIAWGNANEMEKVIDQLRKMEGQVRQIYAARTGRAEDEIRQWMDEETWFTEKEAVEAGFADEVLEAEPIAACVTAHDMAVMQALYRRVPESIAVRAEEETPAAEPVSIEAPSAGVSTENTKHEEATETMDIKDISMDQLRAENPALLEQIQQSAVAAERQRQEDIDALTVPGYEAMAAQAKADGTSALDFQKQIVAAMKQKGANFMQSRREELAPAQDVAGDAPQGKADREAGAEDAAIREIAAYAAAYAGSHDEGMF